MPGLSLQAYRKEWPRVGRVLAMAVGGAAVLASSRLSRPQLLSTLNFGALLVHQYEEYEDPGHFPGQFNGGMFKSATPRNYPLNTNTAMLQSEPMYRSFRPDLEHPTRADAEPVFGVQQAMKIPYIEPEDISNAVLWLASEEARYVTGVQLRVDAGGYLKWYDFHK